MSFALITGASRGLGLALTSTLHDRGWELIVDARDGAALHDAIGHLDHVHAVPGDITDPDHRAALVDTAPSTIDLIVNNASLLGPSPQPALADYPLSVLRSVYETNVLAPLGLIQAALPRLPRGAAILNISSDAAVEAYEGWGGYGSSKAALDHLTAILAAERPDLRVYSVDPGDMRTQMHQEAFPGEDISDRPEPSTRIPALLALIDGHEPSGRYSAEALLGAVRA